MAKWRKIFPVFQGGYCCRFFSPPGHYQEMHSKRRRLSAPRPRMSRPCRQMMRTRSGSSGRSGGQLPKHAGLPASGSFQLRTKPLRMSSSSRAVSNSLKQGILPPRRHNARTPGRCPCVVRWDAVVTASCEAFCEFIYGVSRAVRNKSQPQLAVKPSARLVFFYSYISGSARAFFPGGG